MLKADIKYNELVEYISSVSSDISNHEDTSCKVNYEITFSGETIQSEININHINEQ